MLRLLRISNFAIIDNLEVTFGPGLNVLTGETGAGKSIIFEALHLALGGRASSELVRSGAKEAVVETLFDLPDTPGGRAARTLFEEAGAAIEADGEVLVRRRISSNGRGRIYLNDSMITAATLSAGGEGLVNIHGQHAQQSLLRPATHLGLLDDFAGLTGESAALTTLVGELRAAEGTLEQHLHGVRERAQRADMLRFQVEELEKENLRAGEWEEIGAEIPRLRNAERLRELADGLYQSLYAAEGAVSERLGEALRDLERLAELDPARADLTRDASSTLAQVESLAESLRDYIEEMKTEPGRLEALEERRGRLLEMRRKYGNDEAECLEYLARAQAELEAFADEAGTEARLRGEVKRLRDALAARALALSKSREKSARELDGGMKKGLEELGINGALFETRIARRPDPEGFVKTDEGIVRLQSDGIDQAEFFFSSNPGEAPRPLARVASGGELSRLMLSLEAELRRGDRIPTLIFDEVDAGIGGAVAEVVGRKLLEVSRNHQVLVITHLPQVASLGDVHFRIEKRTEGGRTFTAIEPIEGEARIEEIARMGAGLKVTAAARQHAAEMLKTSKKKKKPSKSSKV